MLRKMILAFLSGCVVSLVSLHLVLSHERIEIWEKDGGSLVFNRVREAYPYWWVFSPTRNSFASDFRKKLQEIGWVRMEENLKVPEVYMNSCFFHFGRNWMNGAFFEIHTMEQYSDGEARMGAQYTGRRYASADLNNLPAALKMCK